VEFATACDTPFCYSGKAGSLFLVSQLNQDTRDPKLNDLWEAVYTPHAAFLAATLSPNRYAKIFRKTEKLGLTNSLYVPNLGWMDGYILKGPHRGRVITSLLSLDQGMV